MEGSGIWKNTGDMVSDMVRRDSARIDRLGRFLNLDHISLMQQIVLTRQCEFTMNTLDDKEKARVYMDKLKEKVTLPALQVAVEATYQKLYDESAGSYELPYGKGAKIFRKIADAHKGKYVLVDFWSTGCGPCRSGIQRSLELRKKLRDHKDVDFIFITSEEESPEAAYNDFVGKYLDGEACYRIPGSDYHYLRELFRFNGIPHYETLNREGRVLRKGLSYYNLEEDLKRLLEAEK